MKLSKGGVQLGWIESINPALSAIFFNVYRKIDQQTQAFLSAWHFLAVCPWSGDLTSLDSGFLF